MAITFATTFWLVSAHLLPAMAAVGCDLNDPDRDIKRLFTNSTGYRTTYASITKQGGEPLLQKIETRLGDKFHGIYETIDIPYTIYTVYAGDEKIGYVHGVNEKGAFGGIQVFIALDRKGTILAFYIQKITSQWAKKLRDPVFGGQFTGLTLKDFESYDPTTGKGEGRISQIANPAPEAATDFKAAMRALKKNLILMDVFVFSLEKAGG